MCLQTQLSPVFVHPFRLDGYRFARLKMQCTLPCLVHRRRYLQMLVLLTVLLLTLRKRSARPITMEEKFNEINLQLAAFLAKRGPELNFASQTLSQTVAAQTTKITSIEQTVGSLLARVTTLETDAQPLALAAPSRQDLGTYSDIVTAPTATGSLGSHGPRVHPDR